MYVWGKKWIGVPIRKNLDREIFGVAFFHRESIESFKLKTGITGIIYKNQKNTITQIIKIILKR